MNKTELTAKLAKRTELSGRQAKAIVDLLFDTDPKKGIISSELTKGHKVQITGFGTFESRKRKKRMGRNPQTGASIAIPASRVPAFSAGKALKDRVNNKRK
jgi:DNA-binding protein HU-beta